MCEGTSNPWGIAWDPEGSFFVERLRDRPSLAPGRDRLLHPPGGPYPPFTWPIDSIVEHKHQKAAYCGIHYFDSDAYPPEYREPALHGQHPRQLHQRRSCSNANGSTYRGIEAPDFLTANDAWFMPVVQKTGPDGCLYILDWYDRYHCYQDANRDPAGIDRLKGRLYRVRYQKRRDVRVRPGHVQPTTSCLRYWEARIVYDRDIAQRILTERGSQAIIARLETLVLDHTTRRTARMHGLWARLGIGRSAPTFIRDFWHTRMRLFVPGACGRRETSGPLSLRSATASSSSPPTPAQTCGSSSLLPPPSSKMWTP